MNIEESRELFRNACKVVAGAGQNMPEPYRKSCLSDVDCWTHVIDHLCGNGAFESDEQACASYLAYSKRLLLTLAQAVIFTSNGDAERDIDLLKVLKTHKASNGLIDLSSDLFGAKAWGLSELISLQEEIGFDEVSDVMNSTKSQAWGQCNKLLVAALNDPLIQQNSETVAFLEQMQTLARTAIGAMDVQMVMKPLRQKVKSELARKSGEVTNQPYEAPRKWVISEWENRSDRKQSKAAFADVYVSLVKREFGILVDRRTISDKWLPKLPKATENAPNTPR